MRRNIVRRDEALRDLHMPIIDSIVTLLLAAAAASASAPLATPAVHAAPTAAALHVRATELRNSTGQVVCLLFNSASAFPSDSSSAIRRIVVPIKGENAVCEFRGIAPGRYALVIFHDENSNGEFDRSRFGMPQEGYAFSNNVKPVFSPPSFEDAAFDYAGGNQWLTLAMIY